MQAEKELRVKECLFCKIVKGESPSWKVHEDADHLAVLDLFPLVKGMTVVMTKKHYDSYNFALPDDVYSGLFLFAKKVGSMLDKALGAQRTMLSATGYGIPHVHVKLYPVIKVNSQSIEPKTYETLQSMLDKDWYSGYVVAMSGKRQATKEEMDAMLSQIRKKGDYGTRR